jgi:sugar phosphate isomerase/epimerase
MTPTSDPLRDFLRHAGQASVAPGVTAASYRQWLEDPQSFLEHAAARAAAIAPPEPLRLLSHSPEAAAAARAEREQKQRVIKPAPPRGLRTAGGEPLTMANAHDTEYARALQRGAQQERETKERLRRQAAENAARRAAAEADVRDATPAKGRTQA